MCKPLFPCLHNVLPKICELESSPEAFKLAFRVPKLIGSALCQNQLILVGCRYSQRGLTQYAAHGGICVLGNLGERFIFVHRVIQRTNALWPYLQQD